MAFRPLQDPRYSLTNLQQEIGRAIERVWHDGMTSMPIVGQWSPAVDLLEYADRYVLIAEVPGVTGDGVDLTCLDNALTIRGERCMPESEEQQSVLRQERRLGEFSRTIELPVDVDADRVSARCQHGVIEVTIAKCETTRPRSIKVDITEG